MGPDPVLARDEHSGLGADCGSRCWRRRISGLPQPCNFTNLALPDYLETLQTSITCATNYNLFSIISFCVDNKYTILLKV